MNDNDRRCVNELYKKIVRDHDPDYCDPETLPMPALCALLHDKVVEKDLRLNSYNAEMCIKERELRELKEKFDNYRLAVESLLRVPPTARENLNAIVLLLDPISLSKEQVRDIYEFLDGKSNPTGEELYKNICEDISKAITEKLTAEAERLIVAADRDRRINELQEKMLKGEESHEEFDEYLKLAKEAELNIHKPLVRTCEKCGKKFIARYRVAAVCQTCQEEKK